MHRIIDTQNAPRPIGPYSQALQIGNHLYCSGQLALDVRTGDLVAGGVEEQAGQALRNICAVLRAATFDVTDIVKATIYLISMEDFAVVNNIYAQVLGDHRPARTTVAVADLPFGASVEIEVVAMRASSW